MTEFALIISTYLDKRAKEIPLSQPFNLGKTDLLGEKNLQNNALKHLLKVSRYIYVCLQLFHLKVREK